LGKKRQRRKEGEERRGERKDQTTQSTNSH
jgi:hypothetical protein